MDSFSRRWPINTKRILSWGLMIVIGRESTMLLFILFLGKISTLGMKNKFWSRLENTFQLASFGVYSSFDPGKESKIFHSHVPIGISICLEETFGHLIRRCRLLGAELFVNITNDVWFPHSKLPEQHFHHGRVRSVENGVPILRSCNTGITGAIDCFGRVVKVLPKSETQVYAMHLTLPMQSYRTLYSLWGDAGILTISSLGMILYLLRKSCRKCITRLIF